MYLEPIPINPRIHRKGKDTTVPITVTVYTVSEHMKSLTSNPTHRYYTKYLTYGKRKPSTIPITTTIHVRIKRLMGKN